MYSCLDDEYFIVSRFVSCTPKRMKNRIVVYQTINAQAFTWAQVYMHVAVVVVLLPKHLQSLVAHQYSNSSEDAHPSQVYAF